MTCYITKYLLFNLLYSISYNGPDFQIYNMLYNWKTICDLICNICFNWLGYVLYNILYNMFSRYKQDIYSWFQHTDCTTLISQFASSRMSRCATVCVWCSLFPPLLFSSNEPLIGTVVLYLQVYHCQHPSLLQRMTFLNVLLSRPNVTQADTYF